MTHANRGNQAEIMDDQTVMQTASRPAGPVVVVTGASAGVGRATAIEFARRGAKVGLLARGAVGLAAAAQDVRRAGGAALPVPTDISDFRQVELAAERVEDEFGPIDVWVNNASTSVFARFKDTEPEEFRRVTEVTYLGTVFGTRAAIDRMSGGARRGAKNVSPQRLAVLNHSRRHAICQRGVRTYEVQRRPAVDGHAHSSNAYAKALTADASIAQRT